MNIAELVKECAIKAYDASLPCDVLFGTVESVEPVTVKTGSLILEGEILSVAKNLVYRDCEVSLGMYEKTIVIEEGLKKGDCVALLRQSGGEGYIVFAKF